MFFSVRTLLIIYCAIIFALLLWPYGFVLPCQGYSNGAVWISDENRIEFQTAGIISAELPLSLYEKIVSGTGFTIEIWLTPAKLQQEGPARIVSYSKNPFYRNFTLGQENDALVFRLRAANTNMNGTSPEITIPGIFAAGQRRHIVVDYDFSYCRIYIDGQLHDSIAFPGGNLANWNTDYQLLIGNERTGDRPWLGSIEQILLYDRPISATEAAQHYVRDDSKPGASGAVATFDFKQGQSHIIYATSDTQSDITLKVPDSVINQVKCDFLTPVLEKRKTMDFVSNFAIFFIFGILCFISLANRFRAFYPMIIITFCTTLLLALAVESLQYYVEARTSSLFDLFSSLGGGLAGGLSAGLVLFVLKQQPPYHH